MTSLTIRLDQQTDSLLSQLAETLNLSKSAIARNGIISYLEQQKSLADEKAELEKSLQVSSIEEVQNRVAEAQAAYQLSDDEYEQQMNEFFAKELGLVR